MSVEDRRQSIVDAALPLLRERGADVTTREIADAAGVAEGTIFRAFTDKQEIIAAVIERAMDPEPTYAKLRAIDPALSLEQTVTAIVHVLRERFSGVVGLMSVLHQVEGAPGNRRYAHTHSEASGVSVTTAILERHAGRMRIEPAAAAHIIRVLVFGVTMPRFGSEAVLTTDDIVDFVLRGVVKEGA